MAQTRGREKGRGKRLYPALLISIKIRGGAKAFRAKSHLLFFFFFFLFADCRLQSWETRGVLLPPFWTPGLAPDALSVPAACRAVLRSTHPMDLGITWLFFFFFLNPRVCAGGAGRGGF